MRSLVRHPLAGLALVLLATFAVYAPSLANGFTMDDRLVAMGVNDAGQPNARIYELQPLGVYFTTPYWGDTNERDVLYRPLTILGFALRHHFFGDAAWPAHLANVLLHVLATGLVYALLRLLLAGSGAALLGAALFGLHAIHSEVVANVVGRAELLAFVLGAGALLLWQRGEEARGARRLFSWIGSATLLLGAFFSKESAVAWLGFFFVFALARWWRDEGRAIPWRQTGGIALRVGAVAAVPLILFLFLRHRMIAAQGFVGIEVADLVNPIFHAPAPVRMYTATWVLAYAALLVAAPFRLSADYSIAVFEVIRGVWHWKFLVAAGALGGLGLAAVWHRRRQPLLLLAAAAFFGFALITSNLLFPIGTIFGERLLYAPSLAWPLVGVWAWERWGRDPGGCRMLLLIAGLWLGASSLVIVQRNPVWKDDATLFLHEAGSQPRSARMQMNAASVRHDRGELEAAANHLETAVELDPEHALGWNNLAAIRLEQGRLEEAEAAVRRGLRAEHVVEGDLFKLRCNLGLILLRRGQPREGAEELTRCLHLEPGFLRPWRELVALAGQGVLTEADLEDVLERGEEAAPSSPYWPLYRGLLAHRRGRFEEAAQVLGPALIAVPRYGPWVEIRAEGELALADALLRRDRLDEARQRLRSLAEDPFAPGTQRELAQRVLREL